MIVIYRKSDLTCVGTVTEGMTIEQEIGLNVIPNFGGVAGDYETIETEETNFHLELISDVLTIVKNQPLPLDTQPKSELEILQEKYDTLQVNLADQNQQFSDFMDYMFSIMRIE